MRKQLCKSSSAYVLIMFGLVYFVATAPLEFVMSNWCSATMGAFFFMSDVLHRKDRRLSWLMIPATTLFTYLVIQPEVRLYGTLAFTTALLVDWAVFDRLYFYSSRTLPYPITWWYNRHFWASAIASNLACAFVNSVMASYTLPAAPPPHSILAFVSVTLILLIVYNPSGGRTWASIQFNSMALALAIFLACMSMAGDPMIDPYAVQLTEELCYMLSCTPDDELTYVVDMISTSLFKILLPVIGFWVAVWLNKLLVAVRGYR